MDRRSRFSWKTLTGKQITFDGETYDTVDNIQSKIRVLEGTLPDKQRLTCSETQLEKERMISDCNIIHGPPCPQAGDSKAAYKCQQSQCDVRTASASAETAATQQATTVDLRQNLESLRRLGRNRRCHQERPDERTLSEEVHQHASVW